MRNIFLCLFALLVVSPLATANPCRAMTSNLEDRSACMSDSLDSGYLPSGDWLIRLEATSDGFKHPTAINLPLIYFGPNRNLKTKRQMKFFCFGGRVPILTIQLDTPIAKDSKVYYKNETDEYTNIYEDEFSNEIKRSAGVVKLTDKDLLKNIFAEKLLSIRANTANNKQIEVVYTMDMGEEMESSFKCLGDILSS